MSDQDTLSRRMNLIAQAAVISEKTTGLPAELSSAQCALESGWLIHAPGNNCFGIKYCARHTAFQKLATTEYVNGLVVQVPQTFAVFPTLADCFIDHANLIVSSPIYAKAWHQYLIDHDLNTLVAGVAVHYATDPAYSSKIINLITTNSTLKASIAEARLKIYGGQVTT